MKATETDDPLKLRVRAPHVQHGAFVHTLFLAQYTAEEKECSQICIIIFIQLTFLEVFKLTLS